MHLIINLHPPSVDVTKPGDASRTAPKRVRDEKVGKRKKKKKKKKKKKTFIKCVWCMLVEITQDGT